MLENRPQTLQVQGLNTEYERLRKESESNGAAKGGAIAVGEGPTNVQGLRKPPRQCILSACMQSL